MTDFLLVAWVSILIELTRLAIELRNRAVVIQVRRFFRDARERFVEQSLRHRIARYDFPRLLHRDRAGFRVAGLDCRGT